mgnify:CR=1 FL=1
MTAAADIAMVASSVIAGATPIVLASVGETLTERSGLINLSLDGTIILSAMSAFVVAMTTSSIAAGFVTGAMVGALVASVVGVFCVRLGLSQVAVGFVLTLMTRDLAYFLGSPYARKEGPVAGSVPVPVLSDIPLVGTVLFHHSIPVYLSMLAIVCVWWVIYKTSFGLRIRCVGENPEAAYARGIHPDRMQLICALAGGAMVGMAGAAFSLAVKPGWGQPQGCEGTGWIALALVIFGGWHPVKTAIGAYLFSLLQVMSIHLQTWFPGVPAQVFQVAPFPVMIFILVLVYAAQSDAVRYFADRHALLGGVIRALGQSAPASLGRRMYRA